MLGENLGSILYGDVSVFLMKCNHYVNMHIMQKNEGLTELKKSFGEVYRRTIGRKFTHNVSCVSDVKGHVDEIGHDVVFQQYYPA